MRKMVFFTSIIGGLLAVVQAPTLAQCVARTNASVWNSTTGYQTCTYSTPGTDILTKHWLVGLSTTNNSGSDTTVNMITGNSQVSGAVFPFTNWQNGAVVSLGHPAPQGTSCDRNAFLYSVFNGGNCQYLVMSVKGDGSNFDFDAVTNGPGNVLAASTMPPITSITGISGSGTGPYTFTVHWTALTAAQLKGYWDADPGQNIITGYVVRYLLPGQNSRPTISPAGYATSAWAAADSGAVVTIGTAGSDPGQATVTVNGIGTSRLYVALSILADGNTPAATQFAQTDFVGGATYVTGGNPTPSGVFARFEATVKQGNVKAMWQSNVETGVAQYQVFASASADGPFTPIASTVTAPKGNNSTYTVKFPWPKQIHKKSVYFKVKDSDRSGAETWSDVVNITRKVKTAAPGAPEEYED